MSPWSRRTPPPPPPVVEWIRRWGGGGKGVVEAAPLGPGLRALRAALATPAAAREGAHALLAADALLTWAVEDAAGASDPEAVLRETLQAVIELDGAGGLAEGAPPAPAFSAPPRPAP